HAIRDAVNFQASNDELRTVAAAEGMKTMFEQAMAFVDAGITTVEELLRVIPMAHELRLVCAACQRALAGSFKFCPYCGQARAPRAPQVQQFALHSN
ncbi:MAG TPA: hypothetical protein VE998_08720, partial [Terriglobales bacterium]|nr:hypothetical protein [Terriglobales bacterium]